MPNYASKDIAFFLVGGYSILGAITTLTDSGIEAVLQDRMPLGASAPDYADTGGRKWALSQGGLFDDATGSSNDAISGKQGLSRVLCWGVEGNLAGRRFTGAAGSFASKYLRKPVKDKFHEATADYAISGSVDEGRILHALKQETAAGNTEGADSVDNAASSASGGAAYLQVSQLALGGYTNLTVKVRHSADDITYADLTTFAVVTAAPAAERKVVAGTVNRHLAASWAWTGSGSGQSATFMVGFARA